MCFVYEFWNMSLKNFSIRFCFQKPITLKERRRLKDFLIQQLRKVGKTGAEINYVFCSDEELLSINQTHLNHDYYTDIITFDLSEKNSPNLVSDIYISTDRVKDNAKAFNVPQNTELLRVIFHGVLHLIGYKDKTLEDQAQMRSMEEQWLKTYLS